MELGQLRAFLAVAEDLHFARAAERLHIAQPYLSRTIKQLELELKIQLFARSTRSVKLTASGHALITPAREILAAHERASSLMRLAAEGQAGIVRVSFGGLSSHRLLAELARSVRTSSPGIQLQLRSLHFGPASLKELLIDKADLAIGHWDFVPAQLDVQTVMSDSLVVAVPDSHPLAHCDAVSPTALTEQPFITLPRDEGSILFDRLQRLGRLGDFITETTQVAPDTPTALAFVSAGLGLHLTFTSAAVNFTYPRIVFIPLAPTVQATLPDVHLRAAWRHNDQSTPLIGVLAQLRKLVN
ncbi:LysR-type transcriptional regulator [Mycobacteroides abscessus subsp. abscessus]|nr:LysR substrate-binding domain-containing protein [Mycobacteroides abscessus]SIL80951.1 LysR-type transcriptional regulator [Mycobacteroides abscessus subsp. abscessus]SLE51720.1 LysR-type transcriptional regulator [Mycobacteroides abscessus subsp. abscessus]